MSKNEVIDRGSFIEIGGERIMKRDVVGWVASDGKKCVEVFTQSGLIGAGLSPSNFSDAARIYTDDPKEREILLEQIDRAMKRCGDPELLVWQRSAIDAERRLRELSRCIDRKNMRIKHLERVIEGAKK